MPFLAWNDKLITGVETIDSDHVKMIALINELFDAIAAGQSRQVLGAILDQLVAYTQYHFAHEEAIFLKIDYVDRDAHKKEHDEMAAWARKTQEQFRNGQLAAPSLEVMNYLKDWLFDHVMGSDQKFVPYLNSKGVR